jgi:hypothetical protein
VNVDEGYAFAWGSLGAPMGGMGVSGIGRRHGPEDLLKYTEPQTIATRPRVQPRPAVRHPGGPMAKVAVTHGADGDEASRPELTTPRPLTFSDLLFLQQNPR